MSHRRVRFENEKKLNDYQIFVAKLYASCEITVDNVVLMDVEKVSRILEMEFAKVGLLEAESEE